jgi:hypothetical protein
MNIDQLESLCRDATSAQVELDPAQDDPDELYVCVCWPETRGADGDYCHGQNTIVAQALAVLRVLAEEGWVHCDFGGRKDLGHSGGICHFAVRHVGGED